MLVGWDTCLERGAACESSVSWPMKARQRPSPGLELPRALEQESSAPIKLLGHEVNHFQKLKGGNFQYYHHH